MFNTKTYDSTNNNYNTNFDTYIIGNNNIPVDGVKYYNNKFSQVMSSFIVDGGDTILGGNLIVTEAMGKVIQKRCHYWWKRVNFWKINNTVFKFVVWTNGL